jgi:WD40 repeat protein
MTRAFISYSRKDIAIAKRLTAAFHENEIEPWIDWEDIPPSVDWWEQVEKGIEEADCFLFLMSPDSVKSEVCGKEIAHAVQNGNRIIPLVVHDIEPKDTPTALAKLNWIFVRENDDFDTALKKLVIAIHTDFEWVQNHRRLQNRALEWERRGKDKSLLLRGKDLADAEQQLSANATKDPQSTELQRRYVLESRKSADRQRRVITSIAIAGVIALAVLAVFGFLQADLANQNAAESRNNAATAQAASTLAVANQQLAVNAQATTASNLVITQNELRKARVQSLSAQSELLGKELPSLSTLLALEAIKLNQAANEPVSQEAYQALRDTFYNTQGIPVQGNTQSILAIQYSKDGHWFATAGKDGLVRVWDTTQSPPAGPPLFTFDCQQGEVSELFFSNNSARLVSRGSNTTICFWDMTASDPSQTVHQLTLDLPAMDDFAVSPDGHWAAAGNVKANQIVVWDLEKNEIFNTFKINDSSSSQSFPQFADRAPGLLKLAFKPDSSVLLAANDFIVAFWSLTPAGATRLPSGSIRYEATSQTTSNNWRDVDSGDTWTTEVEILVDDIQFTPDGKKIIGSGTAYPTDNGGEESNIDTNTYVASPVFILNSALYLSNPLLLPRTYWDSIQRINISPDGRWLAGVSGSSLSLWDLKNLSRDSIQLEGHQGPISMLVFSPDSKWLASVSPRDGQGDGTARLWNLSANNPAENALVIPASSKNAVITFDSQSQWLAVSNEDQLARFFNLETGDASVDPLEFSDSGLLYSFSWNDHYWKNPEMSWLVHPEYCITGGKCVINDMIAVHPSILALLEPGSELLGYFPGGTQLIYQKCYDADTPTNTYCTVFEIDTSVTSPTPKKLFTTGEYELIGVSDHWLIATNWLTTTQTEAVYYMDLNAPNPLATTKPLTATNPFALSPAGRWLATGTNGHFGFSDLSQLDQGIQKNIDLNLSLGTSYWPDVSFSADGCWLFSNSETQFYMWELSSSKFDSPIINIQYYIEYWTISPDQHWFGFLDQTSKITLMDLSKDKATVNELQLPAQNEYIDLAFSPDSRWLATVDKQGNTSLYDLSGANSTPLIPNRALHTLASLTFNSDKENILLAGGTTNGKILLWSMNDLLKDPNTLPIVLQGGVKSYNAITFTPDNEWIIANGTDEPIQAWRVRFDDVLKFACEAAGRNLTRAEWAQYSFTEPYRATCPQWSLEPESTPTPTPTP